MKPCVCGHDRVLHDHHRAGTDCARRGCGCPRYRRRHWWRRTPRPPAAVTSDQALPRPGPPPGLTWVKTTHQAACGCFHVLDHRDRTRTRVQCKAHKFASEMEARMRQT